MTVGDDSDSPTPPRTHATIAVHDEVLRRLCEGQDRMIEELRGVRDALSRGDARFEAIEDRQANCNARHDRPEMVALMGLPSQVAVLSEQMDMMRKVVYGGVAVALVGLLGTVGAVMVKVLGQP